MANLAQNISKLESRKAELAKLEDKRVELTKEIAQLSKEIANELGLVAPASNGRAWGRTRSPKVDLTQVKSSILSTLKDEGEWITTMALSTAVMQTVPDSDKSAIARAKSELVEAGEIKTKGAKRGAQYHIA